MDQNKDEDEKILNNILEELQGGLEGFSNELKFDRTCVMITILFILLFIYKKEVIEFFK
jgi:hypothetical protein|tara:strand:+ start:393 stop:569 length:177 start_codon:yes stop_codon:yes gene_type:complete